MCANAICGGACCNCVPPKQAETAWPASVGLNRLASRSTRRSTDIAASFAREAVSAPDVTAATGVVAQPFRAAVRVFRDTVPQGRGLAVSRRQAAPRKVGAVGPADRCGKWILERSSSAAAGIPRRSFRARRLNGAHRPTTCFRQSPWTTPEEPSIWRASDGTLRPAECVRDRDVDTAPAAEWSREPSCGVELRPAGTTW